MHQKKHFHPFLEFEHLLRLPMDAQKRPNLFFVLYESEEMKMLKKLKIRN